MIQHKSVLQKEVIGYLSPKSPKIYVDATVGCGGHAERILKESSPNGKLVGIDLDPYMLNLTRERLSKYGKRCILIEDNFVNLDKVLKNLKLDLIDGIIFDLGVATEHFTIPERGFSIERDGPLDMRLSPHTKLSAQDIVNNWKQEEIADILYKFGEENKARRIARQIIEERKKKRIATTAQLKEIVERAIGGKQSIYAHRIKGKVPGYKIHPATRTFQALRIAVNNELNNIRQALPVAFSLLKTGARLCAISFHSLEDRIVKEIFRSLEKPCICPREAPVCTCGLKPKIKIITKKPIVPTKEEINNNPRSRSAKLRVAEKI